MSADLAIAFTSDLHVEGASLDIELGEAEVWVVPGDVYAPPLGDRLDREDSWHPAVEWLDRRRQGRPVLWTLGNHDYEGCRYDDALAAARRACAGTDIHLLVNDRLDLGGVRFLGTPLWCDPRRPGLEEQEVMAAVERLTDLRRARDHRGRPLDVAWLVRQHQHARAFLAAQLAQAPQQPTVVFTHWPPSRRSQSLAFAREPHAGYWTAECEDLVVQATCWLHGHIHDSLDYRLGTDPARGRVLANPRGFSRTFNLPQNPGFVQPKIIRVPTGPTPGFGSAPGMRYG